MKEGKLKPQPKKGEASVEILGANRYERMLLMLPIACDWVEYKGEVCVAQVNYEATVKANKPMVDLSYCMTKALNQCILKTVQWDKKKFKLNKQS